MKNLFAKKDINQLRKFTFAFWINLTVSMLILALCDKSTNYTMHRLCFTLLATACFFEKWVKFLANLSFSLSFLMIILLITSIIVAKNWDFMNILEGIALVFTMVITKKNKTSQNK